MTTDISAKPKRKSRVLRTVVLTVAVLAGLFMGLDYYSARDPGALQGRWVGGMVANNPEFGFGSMRFGAGNLDVTYRLRGKGEDGLRRVQVIAHTPNGSMSVATYAVLPDGGLREEFNTGMGVNKAELRRASN